MGITNAPANLDNDVSGGRLRERALREDGLEIDAIDELCGRKGRVTVLTKLVELCDTRVAQCAVQARCETKRCLRRLVLGQGGMEPLHGERAVAAGHPVYVGSEYLACRPTSKGGR